MLCYAMLCCAVLCYAMLCYAMLCYTMLYYTILYYTILYYTILYYTILYYTILYYTILYYTITLHAHTPRPPPPCKCPEEAHLALLSSGSVYRLNQRGDLEAVSATFALLARSIRVRIKAVMEFTGYLGSMSGAQSAKEPSAPGCYLEVPYPCF